MSTTIQSTATSKPLKMLMVYFVKPRKRKSESWSWSRETEEECLRDANAGLKAMGARFQNAKFGRATETDYGNDCVMVSYEPFQDWKALTADQLKALLV